MKHNRNWAVTDEAIDALIENHALEQDKDELRRIIKEARKTRTETEKRIEIEYTCAPILVPVTNGLISGAASVIGAYIFRPIWNRIVGWWKPAQKQQEKTECQIK
jgi:hypothetical protein